MKRMLLLPVCFLLLMILVGCSWVGASTAGRPDAEPPLSAVSDAPGPEPSQTIAETGEAALHQDSAENRYDDYTDEIGQILSTVDFVYDDGKTS